jgi:hypothetical protein
LIVKGAGNVPVFSVACIGFGFWFFLRGFKLLRIERQIRNTPLSKVRSMAMGMVELFGLAHAAQKIVDPIYSLPCVFFKIKVEERRGSGKHAKWVTLFNADTSVVPFFLEDSTGRALVIPGGADLQRPPTIKCHTGFWSNNDDAFVGQFISKVGGGSAAMVRLEAYILREGDPVFLLGYTAPVSNSASNYTVSSEDAALQIKQSPSLLASLDTNHDGQVDSQEWSAGLKAIKGEMEHKRMKEELAKEKKKEEPVPPIVSKSPEGLLILGADEGDILRALSWKSWAMVIAGPVLVVLGLYLLRLFVLSR